MAEKKIPEVDIIVDEKAGVIREVEQPKKLRSKKGHERRVNGTIYTVLTVMSIVWLVPFVFLVLQSFRSYKLEKGGMVDYLIPKPSPWTTTPSCSRAATSSPGAARPCCWPPPSPWQPRC